MKLRITFTYSCSIKHKKNKETLSLFVLGVRNVIAKKAGQRFEVDVVQKMLIPKNAIKDKLLDVIKMLTYEKAKKTKKH